MNEKLAKSIKIIPVLLNILIIISWLVLTRLIKKWEHKRVEEVEYPLIGILRIIQICIAISAVVTIIGIFLRE